MSGESNRRRAFAEGFLLASLVWLGVVLIYRLLDHPHKSEIAVVPPPATVTPSPSPTPSPIYVYVSGAVGSPGVYKMPPDSRVRDAIELAGGASKDANLDSVNLAARVKDGEKIHVSRIGEPTPGHKPTRIPTPTVEFPVDINKASLKELEALPRIGPSLAKRIVENRPYATIEDIMKVPGIGQSTFEKIKDKITVGK